MRKPGRFVVFGAVFCVVENLEKLSAGWLKVRNAGNPPKRAQKLAGNLHLITGHTSGYHDSASCLRIISLGPYEICRLQFFTHPVLRYVVRLGTHTVCWWFETNIMGMSGIGIGPVLHCEHMLPRPHDFEDKEEKESSSVP